MSAAPAPAAGNPQPAPAPVPRPARAPPATSGLGQGNPGKARDIVNNAQRIDNFKALPRLTCEAAQINDNFIVRLVAIAELIIRLVWNQGANTIDPIPAGANAANIQIAVLARNLVHHFFIDVFVGIRNSVKTLDPQILNEHYSQELGSTGLQYVPFFSHLYSMLMPTVTNRALAEMCYILTFELDLERAHDNWFNIPNMAANNVSARRANALTDVFKRSRSIATTVLKVGGKLGSAATFFDFWPLNNPNHANSWLYMDNNYNDMDQTVMFIIGTDIYDQRLGPHFTHPPTPDRNTRDNYVNPFNAAVTEQEDADDPAGEYVDTDTDPHSVAIGHVYTRTIWSYTSRVLREIDPFLQEQALNIFNSA